ncbi:hypothetical protein BC643_0714 [Mangrovibacterium diazotrophicum]|uniref:Uncharacterized protein n=1 Tax=Mangrovibacterium diazotrophicum TaxID=1261403 RepID=A0A419W4L1_9BACT|nr:hypothetical protein BC643_0714 [Mangrovibacterium diazotrophicum]
MNSKPGCPFAFIPESIVILIVAGLLARPFSRPSHSANPNSGKSIPEKHLMDLQLRVQLRNFL